MKIVTWNMARRRSRAAWNYLLNEINPDIAFLQEVLPIPPLLQDEHLIHECIGETRNWGSAIYTSNLPIRPLKIDPYTCWVMAGEIKFSNSVEVVAVSVHAQIIKQTVFPHLKEIFERI